ncbi:Uncharacterized protein APZ42_024134 [Daphnia magna]|uniref:Uncharacterized protein n=1 Tax=Daphnia magna TaxID=35525 RepID=A0A164UGX9_9CRUS|nr:Uncharacterized protein APZ42_024134 [Daphnia magna]
MEKFHQSFMLKKTKIGESQITRAQISLQKPMGSNDVPLASRLVGQLANLFIFIFPILANRSGLPICPR